MREKPDTAESDAVLDDVSFTIKAGSTLGILGSTGSGKSTLMQLLDRLYILPSQNGRITVGGVDIADMKASWVRSNIGFVLQEPFLFSRTLAENIAIAAPEEEKDASGVSRQDENDTHDKAPMAQQQRIGHAVSVPMAEVRRASRIASLDDTVQRFTKGYETFVGERGVTLSGGQKQRTAIAQMLIRHTPIMVFDDSLSAVDAQTDAKIRKALEENTGSATCILIGHRITTLMNADQIIVMDKGKIAEQGTHEELLALGGIYRKIYDLQTNAAL